MKSLKTYEELVTENEDLHRRLEEATETIEAIRTGQIDALVVQGRDGNQKLYTLKTADQTYRVFIEKMNEGALTLNESGVILYCNSKFASILKYPLSKVVGKKFDNFIPGEHRESFDDLFKEGWIEDSNVEITIQGKDRQIPCQVSVTTLEMDGGISLSMIITDLTFQKDIQAMLKRNNIKLVEANTELEKSNRDLQLFASVASHDLQEPLRKVQIFATLLKDKYKQVLSGDGETYLEKIITSSSRMKSMIADILTYARLTNDSQQYVMTNLRDIVNDVLDDYELLIAEKKARFIIGELPEIEANKGEMRQVFQNLISNALKFSKEGVEPLIEIGKVKDAIEIDTLMRVADENCCIQIKDNGIGFDQGFEKKIFSLFQRLNTKDKYEGSGIGLAITKKIVDKHNGQIWAVSSEGSGSEFTIVLPLFQNKVEHYG